MQAQKPLSATTVVVWEVNLILILKRPPCLHCMFIVGGGCSDQNSSYRGTRICPSIVFSFYFSTPRPQSLPGVSGCDVPSLHCSSSMSDSDDVLSFSLYRSRQSCYKHLQDTHAPGFLTDCSHRSRICRVPIYCATIFCLLVT